MGAESFMNYRALLTITSLFLVFSAESFAMTPQVEGLGGAGRGGIPKEALFSNPAAVGLLKQNTAFLAYKQTKLRDLKAGGRVQLAGIYDGSTSLAHGGIAYIRESRRVSLGAGTAYADNTTIRTVIGRELFSGLQMGIKTNYKIKRNSGVTKKYFYGDVGFLYPLFRDLPIGLTVENAIDETEEHPRTIFMGVRFDVDGPLDLYGDLGKTVSSRKSSGTPWATGLEAKIFDELFFRGGIYRDALIGVRGWAVGLSYISPRTAFEYSLKRSTSVPRQTDHTLGASLVF
jgi:hypothetical protein